MKFTLPILLLFLSPLLDSAAHAAVREYEIVLAEQNVNVTGTTVSAMTVNNGIPGPTLRFQEGDIARISVRNEMTVATSVHWHGLLVPNRVDGVPYLTTPPIGPGETHVYEFPLRHEGTYWYHSHTGLQEQRGVYGSIVVEPVNGYEHEFDRDMVLVLSDWTNEHPDRIFRSLKRGSHWYAFRKGAMQTFAGALKRDALGAMLKRSAQRMPPMDISDVAYDAFLINGRETSEVPAKPGERIRLRIINAGASTYFYTQFGGQGMRVIAADGVDVEPFDHKRLLIAIAETYDVIVTVPDNGKVEFRATAQDGSGHASLFLGSGRTIAAPDIPHPDLYNLHGGHDMSAMDQGSTHHVAHLMHNPRPTTPYENLRATRRTALPADSGLRVVELELTGDMERYVWSMNGKTLNEADMIRIQRGQKVRFVMINRTMMHHPMHLHGHFFRVVNKHGEFSPLKHTVDVPPMGKTVIEFAANEEKDWFFHCHVLYHMKAGMSRIVRYEDSDIDEDIAAMRDNMFKDPWYSWGEVSLLSQMSEGELITQNTRNSFSLAWENGWQEDEYEAELLYGRYFNRFFRIFAGAELVNGEHDDRAVVGIYYLLPHLFESRAWVDSDGDVRVMFDKHFQITDRLQLFVDYEFDTERKSEWNAGGAWLVNRNVSLRANYHSEFGAGAGVTVRF